MVLPGGDHGPVLTEDRGMVNGRDAKHASGDEGLRSGVEVTGSAQRLALPHGSRH